MTETPSCTDTEAPMPKSVGPISTRNRQRIAHRINDYIIILPFSVSS
jgi:hypothetical protein